MTTKKTLKFAVFFGTFFLVLFTGGYLVYLHGDFSNEESSGVSEHEQAPAVPPSPPKETKLLAVNGTSKTLGDYQGKVILLNFWASWCGPCMHEMPALYALQKTYEKRGFVVLAINMDSSTKPAVEALEHRIGKAPFEIFQGDEQAISNLFSISGLPYNVILDKKGDIQKVLLGEYNWNSKSLRNLIESYL